MSVASTVQYFLAGRQGAAESPVARCSKQSENMSFHLILQLLQIFSYFSCRPIAACLPLSTSQYYDTLLLHDLSNAKVEKKKNRSTNYRRSEMREEMVQRRNSPLSWLRVHETGLGTRTAQFQSLFAGGNLENGRRS